MAAIALICVILRLLSRLRGPRRLYWDDIFVILAEILVIAAAVVWQWSIPLMDDTWTKLSTIPGRDAAREWIRVQLVIETVYYTALVLVKLSLLCFFRRLGRNVQKQKYIWWPVLLFSLIVYAVSVGDTDYKCINTPPDDIEFWCTLDGDNSHTMTVVRVNMILDVVSDILSKGRLYRP